MSSPRKVILAYDGSNGAKQALEDLRRNRAGLPGHAEVLVLCVADVWTPARFGAYGLEAAPVTSAQLEMIQDAQRTALKDARGVALAAAEKLRAARPGWEVRAESSSNAPAWGIVKRAEEWKAELIVIGSHGRSAVGRVVLGSVSHAVVREAPCGVRVVRGRIGRRDAPARIVIGMDGSADAEAAVQAVTDRVWPPGSSVRLVTGIDNRLSTAVSVRRPGGSSERRVRTVMQGMIEDPAQRLRAAGLSAAPVIKPGDPRKVIVAEADRWDADAVFVGARGLQGIRRFLLGSVSTAVAMRAPCPVEVVRPAPSRVGQGPVAWRGNARLASVRAG